MESNTNTQHISIDKERDIRTKEIIKAFVMVPNQCDKCGTSKISLINKENLINPIIGKCSNYKYHTQIYLRAGTIFASHKKAPSSVLFNILKFWLIDELKVIQISNKLEEIYIINNIEKRMIFNFISNMREIIANNLIIHWQ